MSYTSNLLLDSLPEPQRKALLANLKPVDLKQHRVLFDVREAVETVYFPFDAVVSLVLPLSTGEAIEIAMVGRDGVVGAAAAINGRISLNRAIVQLGGHGLACDIKHLKALIDENQDVRKQINAHEQALFSQSQQSAACNATHRVESRLARSLLRGRDLSGKDQLDLTQEYLAEMLGVGRTTVSLIAHTLQTAGLINYRRGQIRLADVDGLQEVACECYQAVKLNYDAIMTPSNT
jgi:CRP-like cAMP-binding protein